MSKRTIAVSGYVLVLALATGVLCGVAIRAGALIPAAIPVAMIPVVGLYFLRPDEEFAGWVFLTAALGGTYLDGGAPFEFAGALGIATLAELGTATSSGISFLANFRSVCSMFRRLASCSTA
jgi:hypothetical protein